MIKKGTFKGCSKLNNVTIPSSVEYIYQEAFYGCNILDNLKILAITPPIAYDNTFSNYSVPIYVPESSLNKYQEISPWNKFVMIKGISETFIYSVNNSNPILENSYSLDGKILKEPQNGINIIRMSDGRTKKIVVK